MKKHYVTAVLELLSAGAVPEDVIKGLQKTLSARRQDGLFVPVLERVITILEASDSEKIVVTVASEHAVEVLKENITQASEALHATEASQKIIVDPTIIGGSIVQYRDKVIDASYKNALVQLYRSITTY